MNERPKRGILLTAGLSLLVIVNIGFALLLFVLPVLCFGNPCGLEQEIVLPLISLALNLIFIYLLFRWKRWGLYGLIGVAIFNLLVGLLFGSSLAPGAGLFGLIIAALASLIIIPKRKLFH